MTYRILHIADLHLETSFAGSRIPSSLGTRRRADLRLTLERLTSIARERSVDAVTIAGDLYDHAYALPDVAEFLVTQLGELSPTRVIIAPGLHDPGIRESLYGVARWPANVTIFDAGRLSRLDLTPHLQIWGAGHPLTGAPLLQDVHVDGDGVNVLLIHGQLLEDGAPVSSDVAAITAEGVLSAGFNLALLGSQHTGRAYPVEDPYCFYPGSPEILNPDEGEGEHGAVLITIDDSKFGFEFVSTAQWRYVFSEMHVTESTDRDDALRVIRDALVAAQALDDERAICTIRVIGSPAFHIDFPHITDELESQAFIRFDLEAALPVDIEVLAKERTIRGMMAKRTLERVRAMADPEEHQQAIRILSIGRRALEGKEVRSHAGE